jgi:predicted acetyltransferase
VPIEIRPIEADEIDALLVADQRGFGGVPLRPDSSRSWAAGELDRTRIAFENGRIVGVSRTYTFELTMPGGALLPAAAVSWVSVQPTHRRRGILTRMMAAMHDDARDRNEPAAILTASESSIYGRFGYGVAAWNLRLAADRVHIRFAPRADDAGCVRLVDQDQARRVLPEIYDRARLTRAGMVTRPPFWWDQVYWDSFVARTKACFFAIHTDAAGHDDGYVVYGMSADGPPGTVKRELMIIDMQAESSGTWIELWRYVFGVDLVDRVRTVNTPVDDPLRHVVVDSRRVEVTAISDHLWLAPIDPARVLGARRYSVPGRVVITTHLPDGGAQTVAVEASEAGTSCEAVDEAPDLTCDSTVLGMCALGGNRWSELANAGRVEVGRPEALARADAMFMTTPAPALLSFF